MENKMNNLTKRINDNRVYRSALCRFNTEKIVNKDNYIQIKISKNFKNYHNI